MDIYNPSAIGVTAGFGVPTGGTSGQILQKVDGTNYNTQWQNASATNVSQSWLLANSYVTNALVVRPADGLIYQANAAIPANTTFTIGTTGATWRRVSIGSASTPAQRFGNIRDVLIASTSTDYLGDFFFNKSYQVRFGMQLDGTVKLLACMSNFSSNDAAISPTMIVSTKNFNTTQPTWTNMFISTITAAANTTICTIPSPGIAQGIIMWPESYPPYCTRFTITRSGGYWRIVVEDLGTDQY